MSLLLPLLLPLGKRAPLLCPATSALPLTAMALPSTAMALPLTVAAYASTSLFSTRPPAPVPAISARERSTDSSRESRRTAGVAKTCRG